MKTPRKLAITEISQGFYSHIGIVNGLNSSLGFFNVIPSEISVDIFVDGAKFVRKADSAQFWHILGRVMCAKKKSFIYDWFVVWMWEA
jgi:hypothetical protein